MWHPKALASLLHYCPSITVGRRCFAFFSFLFFSLTSTSTFYSPIQVLRVITSPCDFSTTSATLKHSAYVPSPFRLHSDFLSLPYSHYPLNIFFPILLPVSEPSRRTFLSIHRSVTELQKNTSRPFVVIDLFILVNEMSDNHATECSFSCTKCYAS